MCKRLKAADAYKSQVSLPVANVALSFFAVIASTTHGKPHYDAGAGWLWCMAEVCWMHDNGVPIDVLHLTTWWKKVAASQHGVQFIVGDLIETKGAHRKVRIEKAHRKGAWEFFKLIGRASRGKSGKSGKASALHLIHTLVISPKL